MLEEIRTNRAEPNFDSLASGAEDGRTGGTKNGKVSVFGKRNPILLGGCFLVRMEDVWLRVQSAEHHQCNLMVYQYWESSSGLYTRNDAQEAKHHRQALLGGRI